MTDTITLIGNVATEPTQGQTRGGLPVTNFRLATTHRRFDNESQTWIDAATNWYSVAAFRQLGEHAKASLRCGDAVIVIGRVKIRTWEANGKSGTSVDIDAESIGHDLRWGTSAYLRTSRTHSGDAGSRRGSERAEVDGEADHARDAGDAPEAGDARDGGRRPGEGDGAPRELEASPSSWPEDRTLGLDLPWVEGASRGEEVTANSR